MTGASSESYTAEEETALNSILRGIKERCAEHDCDPAAIDLLDVVIYSFKVKLDVERSIEMYFKVKKLAKELLPTTPEPEQFEKYYRRYRVLAPRVSEPGHLDVMWMVPDEMTVDEVPASLFASKRVIIARHADLYTLRNGIIMVMDAEDSSIPDSKVRSKTAASFKLIPARPQAMYFVEKSMVKRAVINAFLVLIKIFGGTKVAERLEFVNSKQLKSVVPVEHWPARRTPDVEGVRRFVKERLAQFPLPTGWELPDYARGTNAKHADV